MPDAVPEGVSLTKVEISALSPDVITAVLKKITDGVLAAIPEGSLELIAKEVITSQKVVSLERRNWGGEPREIMSLVEATRCALADKLRPVIEQQVAAYFETTEVRQYVQQAIADGVKAALNELPQVVGKATMERMCGIVMTPTLELSHIPPRVDYLSHAMATAQKALVAKGVLMPHEAPGANL